MDPPPSPSLSFGEQTLLPYLGDDPSSLHQIGRRSVAVEKKGKFLPAQRRDPLSVNYDSAEVSLVRVVGRHRIPVIPSAEICVFSGINIDNPGQGSSSSSGASMQVYRGLWNGRKVALKYMRTKAFTGEDGVTTEEAVLEYRKGLHNIVHEVDLMGYKPLRQHRNITNLLAVSFDSSEQAPERDSKQNEVIDAFIRPILVVELAHESFPDLRLFFDPHNNKSLPDPVPFDLSGSLIADIADGMAALHSFSVTHADLKPENVLIFPDQASPTGIVAKISDFGLSGCDVEYPFASEKDRIGRMRGSETRGGSWIWLAPECLGTTDDRQHEASRDIYTFGLLATYIALRGRHPKTFAKDLTHVKLSDSMVETAMQLLEAYCSQPSVDTRLSKVAEIAQTTLRMKPEERIQTLNGIRRLLFNCDEYEAERRTTPTRIPGYFTFPPSVYDAKCSGFEEAFWKCPPAYRERVRDVFRRRWSEKMAIFMPQEHEVWECITIQPSSMVEGRLGNTIRARFVFLFVFLLAACFAVARGLGRGVSL